MALKLMRWAIFGVIIAVLPLAFSALSMATRGSAPTLELLLGRGELLLISAAISAAAIGELFGSSARLSIWKVLAGGSSVSIVILSSLYFADVAAAQHAGGTIDAAFVTLVSRRLFLWTLISSAACIVLAEA